MGLSPSWECESCLRDKKSHFMGSEDPLPCSHDSATLAWSPFIQLFKSKSIWNCGSVSQSVPSQCRAQRWPRFIFLSDICFSRRLWGEDGFVKCQNLFNVFTSFKRVIIFAVSVTHVWPLSVQALYTKIMSIGRYTLKALESVAYLWLASNANFKTRRVLFHWDLELQLPNVLLFTVISSLFRPVCNCEKGKR
jgi:hypothetical protein